MQGNEATVFKQTLSSFLDGPYVGEVVYDGLPINACHILLGRPWLFDNHVMHDAHANTYSLKFKGSEKSLYMSERRVKRAISNSKPLFSLLMV